MKVCSKCGIEKDEGEFYKNKRNKSGLNSQCKSCCREFRNKENLKKYKKEWYEKNKESRREISKKRNKEWRENNKEYVKKWRKEYEEKNKERRREYLEKNKEHRSKQRKEYRENNKEHISKQKKEWNKSSEYYKNRYRNNKNNISEYMKKTRKTIDGEQYNINTVPDELKPIIKQIIDIRNTKKELNEKRKKIEKGEI